MPNNSRLRMIENKEITAWEHSLMASFPCRNKFLALALKKYAKTDIKFLGGRLTAGVGCLRNGSGNI